jgi:hypothetical protein
MYEDLGICKLPPDRQYSGGKCACWVNIYPILLVLSLIYPILLVGRKEYSSEEVGLFQVTYTRVGR